MAGGKKTGAGAPVKLTVKLHGKDIQFTKQDLQEMLSNPMYEQADNLPKWLVYALIGTPAVKTPHGKEYSNPAFKKAYEVALAHIQRYLDAPAPVEITLDKRPNDIKHAWTLSLKENV